MESDARPFPCSSSSFRSLTMTDARLAQQVVNDQYMLMNKWMAKTKQMNKWMAKTKSPFAPLPGLKYWEGPCAWPRVGLCVWWAYGLLAPTSRNRTPAHHILCRETVPSFPAPTAPQAQGWPPHQPDWTLHKDCCGESTWPVGPQRLQEFLTEALKESRFPTTDKHTHADQGCCWPSCLKCGDTASLRMKQGRDGHGREWEGGGLVTPLEPPDSAFPDADDPESS